jgi:signal transduction histidine kinase
VTPTTGSLSAPSVGPLPDPLSAHPLAHRWLRFTAQLRVADQMRPWRLDGVMAAAMTLFGIADLFVEGEESAFDADNTIPVLLVVLIIAGLSLPLIWRRRAPTAVFATILGICAFQWSLGVLLHSDLSMLFALYGLARYAPARRLPWAAAATFAASIVLVLRVELVSQRPVGLFFVCGTATAAIAVGLAARIRTAQLAALADRATRLETEREQRVQLAISAERGRVSREMHDIVGHNLAVIIGLADGGASLAATEPERSAEALRVIAGTGRQALSELRRTLAALRDRPAPDTEAPGAEAALAPQPGTADLDVLLGRARAAGPRVTFHTAGDIAAPAPGAQLAVYRIVQESLTNVLKHAGPDTSVQVSLQVSEQEVRLRVRDTGPPEDEPRAAPADRDGQGLIGIHERAALSGGTAAAGPCPGGGWMVQAVLPVSARKEQP